MKYMILILLFISTPAYAEFGFDNGIRSPQSVVVSGNSVIDEESDVEYVDNVAPDDDAYDISKPEVTTPVQPEVNAFAPPPEVQKPQAVTKKVVKRVSPVQIERSIADDRIDDSYVQELMKKNFDFSNPIE